jgi:hypothetical protein
MSYKVHRRRQYEKEPRFKAGNGQSTLDSFGRSVPALKPGQTLYGKMIVKEDSKGNPAILWKMKVTEDKKK